MRRPAKDPDAQGLGVSHFLPSRWICGERQKSSLEQTADFSICFALPLLARRGKKVVVVAVPGAFTPTCHVNHLPGFIKNAKEVRSGAHVPVLPIADHTFSLSPSAVQEQGLRGLRHRC